MTTAPRIYVACLASYNAGRLYGKWIDASTDTEDMQAEIAEMLRGSPYPNVMVQCPHCEGEGTPDDSACPVCHGKGEVPSAEEWAIHDYEGLGPNLGEYAGLEEVARRVEIAEAAEDAGIPVAVLIEAMNDSGADDAEDFISDQYRGTFDSWADMAEELEAETGGLDEVPERFRAYIDFDRIGRDFELSGDFSAYRDGDHGDLFFFWNH